jgi:tetratricopeptide (TPR) repeat protein
MAEEIKSGDARGTCFVVMGFGKKTDFETGRTLDLDKSYRNMIKPAVQAAGLECIRADEIVHSGLIDVPMYEQLLNADVVVADLSTSNKNAFYELGVRHALRPYMTVVIAEDGIKTFPFDVSHVAVRQYHHLGEDIGFDEVMRFRDALTQAIVEIMKKSPRPEDSPVYAFLKGLNPPSVAAMVQAAVQTAGATAAGPAATEKAEVSSDADGAAATHSVLMQQVDEAQKKGDFVTAKSLLTVVRNMRNAPATEDQQGVTKPEDPYILQRLALATLKSKQPSPEAALKEARDLLTLLSPHNSNDTETLGLWGSVHKHLWEVTKNPADLDKAVRAYGRGFYLRNDYYNGINVAYLLNVRAANHTDPAEAIADYVQARRVRKDVLGLCEEWLKSNPVPTDLDVNSQASKEDRRSRYWALATMAEAYLGLGDETKSQELFKEAVAIAPEPWMVGSTEEQMKNLKPLLSPSPLAQLSVAREPTAETVTSASAS